jgi:RES domain-containing protein
MPNKMQLYRIINENHSQALTIPGLSSRWNIQNEFVLYTSPSRSLARLELTLHESGVKSIDLFSMMVLSLADAANLITTVSVNQLPENWRSLRAIPELQRIGSDWYKNKKSLILKVPSATIPPENLFLLNMKHPDFKEKVSISGYEEL